MGERISFRSADGVERQGFLARAAPGAPGVVVLHEWWGLDEMTERTCEKIAAAGGSITEIPGPAAVERKPSRKAAKKTSPKQPNAG